MNTDWPALAGARVAAHRAAQWATRAARANLAAAPDDSHSSLVWEPGRGALLSQSLPGGTRVGLQLAALELLVIGPGATDSLPLRGQTDAAADRWVDAKLAAAGLKPASGVALPYEVAGAAFAAVDGVALATLARWYAMAANALEALKTSLSAVKPGPSPVRIWPHHFDIATLVALEEGDAEHARSIGAGVSPGDAYYPQPYAYLSPWPKPDAAQLPAPPKGGHWHTRDFIAAVASADEILAQGEPGAALKAFIATAFDTCRRSLHA